MLDEPVHKPKEKVKKQEEPLNEEEQDKTREKGPNSADAISNDNILVKLPEIKPYVPPIPFLQRLKRKANEGRYQKFLKMFKKLQVNILFA